VFRRAKAKFYRINQQINAPKLRVIGPDGKQIGILSLSQAFEEANKKGIDLIEIAPKAEPPVAKIIDYKKFRYLEAKKQKKEKRSKGGELKVIRVSPFIAKADLETRIRKAREFLSEGNKVKIVVLFFGRQLTKREFGYKILKEFKEQLGTEAREEQEPKWLGKMLLMTLIPGQGGKDETKENKNENTKVDGQKIQDH